MTSISEVTEVRFYKTEDIMKMLDCCRSIAQKIIREINKEQEQQGRLVLRGKVSKKAFDDWY